MTKERLQKLAGILTEENQMNLPSDIMNQKWKYVGDILQFDRPEDHLFDNLHDFHAEVMSSWDKGEGEAKKYLQSLSVEGGEYDNALNILTIVSNYSGKKTVELRKR